jgi:uncharacterized NAD(P)/FAD-binding protein YdhS
MSDINKIERPLIKNLISRELIHADELRLGIDATADGAVLNSDLTPSDHLLTIGSTLRGLLWESTAVPELREQSSQMADRLIKELCN